ncbi:uncharacterized protein LOC105386928 isoform X3 [Plutella xylostella]|uniref:uncharacterized protein LOC105386928 isoform X3 n=1 Tax=Plutella xylostella TaxID=51655 RepID=UPI00203260ED|nr:uncharacterized protein LOC105386928 isoform X3 [Plutella xylostella]
MKSVQFIRKIRGPPIYNLNVCCYSRPLKLQVRHSAGCSNLNKFTPLVSSVRNLGLGPTSKDFGEASTNTITTPLTKLHVKELVRHLTDDERKLLYSTLNEYESNRIKEEFEDTLAGQRWRTKLGRPSRVPTLGDVDPTGTYCPMPEDWLKKKYKLETVQKPSTRELLHLSFANSIPFVGFGFLDNFIMIIAGDSIESSMSAYITLSTMAAAALGNTFSDVIGIGSSCYVERAAARIGLRPPALSPAQLDMPVSRRFANMGRVLGITVGCFLGMIPLLFKDDEKKPDDQSADQSSDKSTAAKETSK